MRLVGTDINMRNAQTVWLWETGHDLSNREYPTMTFALPGHMISLYSCPAVDTAGAADIHVQCTAVELPHMR